MFKKLHHINFNRNRVRNSCLSVLACKDMSEPESTLYTVSGRHISRSSCRVPTSWGQANDSPPTKDPALPGRVGDSLDAVGRCWHTSAPVIAGLLRSLIFLSSALAYAKLGIFLGMDASHGTAAFNLKPTLTPNGTAGSSAIPNWYFWLEITGYGTEGAPITFRSALICLEPQDMELRALVTSSRGVSLPLNSIVPGGSVPQLVL